jgi:hypothetical protein
MAENIIGKFVTAIVLIVIISAFLPMMLSLITGIDLTNVDGAGLDLSGFVTILQIIVAIIGPLYLLKHFGIIKSIGF